MILEKITSPADVKKLNNEELTALTGEIRQELMDVVSRNGGHLASNLGIVELTLAIHRVFDLPKDKLIFDVGHQSYVHKLLTGRSKQFGTLRTYGGLSGFPRRDESPYDVFETGHASTAISAALGFARARDYRKEDHHVIAVVGDGALTGGMCYEALNDAGNSGVPMLVILNDNEMSISRNVGALSKHLSKMRLSRGYRSTKEKIRSLKKIPVLGKPVYHLIHGSKELVKSVFTTEENEGFFEALGFRYFGPFDGHDIQGLEKVLKEAASVNGPVVVHVMTRKGNGYEQAENRPETFHGTPPFYVETGDRLKEPEHPSCGHVMADRLAELSKTHPEIVTLTAAMPLGTGLDHFAEILPDRMIDVGIAEEHAVTLSAGMAAGGMRPYFAVYASFFQRCHDQLIHDVCMQDLPVTFLLDRSGIGGPDGQTHHGVFDLAQALPVPNLNVLLPRNTDELCAMLDWTLTQNHPTLIRYSAYLDRSGSDGKDTVFVPGRWEVLAEGDRLTVVTAGSAVIPALQARELLKERGMAVRIVSASSVRPADREFLAGLKGPWITLEEHSRTGGMGAYLTQLCMDAGWKIPQACIGIGERFLRHGEHSLLLKDAGLDPATVAARIEEILKREEKHG